MPNIEHRISNTEGKSQRPCSAPEWALHSCPSGFHFAIRCSVFDIRYSLLAALASLAFLLTCAPLAAAGEAKAADQPKASTDPKVGTRQESPGADLARPASGETPPQAAAQLKALRERLEREKARLAELQTELQNTQGDGDEKDRGEGRGARDEGKAAGTKPSGPVPSASGPVPPASSLLAHPSLGAADVLFRLGRYAEARSVYEALAKQPNAAEDDRAWALLQAGHCCRRLGDFDSAIAHFQQIVNDYPDSPWSKGHVAWALRATHWDKRWGRPAPESGD